MTRPVPRACGRSRALVHLAIVTLVLALPAREAAADGVAPVGYRALCLRAPQYEICHDRLVAGTVTMTPWLRKFLLEVNLYWNHRVEWTSDEAQYGRAEFWTVPAGTQGDCEDYALAKYGQLRRMGIPAGALSMVYGKLKSTGEGHAVLSVHTDLGLFILGNDFDAVLPVAFSEISPMLVQNARRPTLWDHFEPIAASGG